MPLLPRDHGHALHYEQYGDPGGIAVVVLHGGPGAGAHPMLASPFHPDRWHVVMLDQRGCGRSTYEQRLVANTTWDLVGDLEALREHLHVERWVVAGGSWGSTLALAYAQAHPERVAALLLRAVFLCRPEDIRWAFEAEGAGARRPERFAAFADACGDPGAPSIIEAYRARLHNVDPAVCLEAARAWVSWEQSLCTPEGSEPPVPDRTALDVAVLEQHYLSAGGFLPRPLLAGIDAIRHLPTWIVHGRDDACCLPAQARMLADALDDARLTIVPAGHVHSEPAIANALVEAAEECLALLDDDNGEGEGVW